MAHSLPSSALSCAPVLLLLSMFRTLNPKETKSNVGLEIGETKSRYTLGDRRPNDILLSFLEWHTAVVVVRALRLHACLLNLRLS
ncbi:hypothetical protein FB45DRAFT_74714 [Roridomyces roridus]|uniref:Secreted protein n=1 Tax=Roridomyces roridus TaxID=1738132 RepID=A0AAD7BNP8_9AGAR|nr:hypothetical protein FB45DRAFT_74714 [Roridomyces roridus]